MVLPSSPHQTRESDSPSDTLDLPALFESRKPLLDGLLKGFPSKALKLFVVVSTMLTETDYRRIAPILWENGLTDTVDASATASVCLINPCRALLTVVEGMLLDHAMCRKDVHGHLGFD